MTRRDLLFLPGLAAYADLGLAALRLLTGGFLIYGVWDNIVSAERMEEFIAFMAAFGFSSPEILAPLTVWVQFAIGIALVLGLFTRWAGIVLAVNFIVGVIGVHWEQTFREWWPAIVLVAIGLLYATAGAGRWSADAIIEGKTVDRD
ncbi:DoxX family protein [Parasphingopyxis marina]|uniref:DoxX family protein n=1 Tax=Parasphingopyxis marina TaxID=2761622 RepID=A0A842HU89_9SPHN|nr:DoxX family protein [Parasphingopyxis marina]MBC2777528.1 DoxX family protein [Parasphingopyxis marina]